MLLKKKLELERFKKTTQGLIDFATLIEQADPEQRKKMIEYAKLQDPRFVKSVLRKVVYFEELVHLDPMILAEILSATSPKVLAYALFGAEGHFRDAFFKLLGLRERRATLDEEENMRRKPSPRFVLGAQKQILKIARNLEAKNKFCFELAECPRFKQSA